MLSLLLIHPAFAQQPPPPPPPPPQASPGTVVGDMVSHPVTGAISTVVELLGDRVLTDADDVFFVFTTVGDVLTDPNDPTITATIASVNVNAITGLVDQVTLDNPTTNHDPDVIDIATNIGQALIDADAAAQGDPGNPGGPVAVDIPTGNVKVFVSKARGPRGGDGRDGYGIRICVPVFGCATIGRTPHNGGNGGTGPTLISTIPASRGNITTVTNELSGAIISSIGGNGGNGGDAFGNFDGRPGGDAGRGGQINLTSNVDITTSGVRAHGIFAQSRSGFGGKGGSGFILGGGGSGGRASSGGPVTVTSNGAITTFGAGGTGIFGQSMGGAAGDGGDSWGLVGSGGSSRAGGNGGTVALTNNSDIITSGAAGHGIVAQSIGGTGGDGGDAGGIVALGGGGSAGGNGGSVAVTNGANATIRTIGDGSHGVLAQSIGGGGGNGGTSGGVVAIGGGGSAGGSASTVTVTNVLGSVITVEGAGSSGVVAQSIGGGGGDGAASGGLVAIGATGSGAGNGSTVTVNSDATIRAVGSDGKGILAQSIGGGGGSARGTGGLVAIGGRGSTGGAGGFVGVTNGGLIQTDGAGGDAIFVQSIGGGGGSGGSSGGAVSIGGGGASGGAGRTVSVTNTGQLTTLGPRGRGIFAQSIGGGGGTGGDSGGLVSLGGSGSVASSGGAVSVTNSGVINSQGNQSSVIQAQSIGGGGGDGGTSGGVFLTMGGSGGGGGASGTVTVNNSGNLSSMGDDSRGIFAQSIGGGGGNGGNAASGSLFAGVAIGGSGGLGGNGAAVNVTTTEFDTLIDGNIVSIKPLIQTVGDRSNGIFAQSVGGGGGNGGFAIQGTAGTFISVSVAVGGSGGNGGRGSSVTTNTAASILTGGLDSDGFIAQSIGGGGGNGGLAIAGSLQVNPVGGGAISVGIGGSGGGGGLAGSVNSIYSGSIQTAGDLSEGMIVQSLGGGGGNGGFSISGNLSLGGTGSGAVGVGVGGSGGGGGTGGSVTASMDGTTITQGDDAGAILFQSVGGGGGNGGFNISASLSGGGVGSGAVNVGVGGSGGGGGVSGVVDGTALGSVTTSGTRSDGIVMQSIGGGGGNGGFNISFAGSGAGTGSGSVAVGVGGSGGGGGNSAAVTANVDSNVTTTGVDSDGMLIQSVGGGGGNGGFDITGAISGAGVGSGSGAVSVGGSGGGGGDSDVVNATLAGDVTTSGDKSGGVTVQSIGGGGGNGGFSISGAISMAGTGSVGAAVGVGGSGGGGGSSSSVTASYTGLATTAGDDATAILFQSVGGGGGNGGFSIAAPISGAGGVSGAFAVGVGGSGGGGGSSGAVGATVTGDVTTSGTNAGAVLVQSLGGGGGNGGLNISGAISGAGTGSGAVAVGVGGSGGGGGSASAVDAVVTGDVTTSGTDASAILVQSLGGGGGNGGLNISGAISGAGTGGGAVAVGVGGSGGGGGDGDTVDTTVTGDVTTSGEEADAVIVQSLGGGGGNGGLNISGAVSLTGTGSLGVSVGVGGSGGSGGDGSAVDAALTGNVTTSGTGADAILVQSLGGGGGNGGLNISGAISAAGTGSGAVAVGVGGFGGDGGFSGTVQSTVTGNVTTSGNNSVGIIAQSQGGGGGNGGLNVSGSISGASSGSGALAVGVGGFGGGGGNAGTVNSTAIGDIATFGNLSSAFIAQSIGGGGGNGGLNVSGGISFSKSAGGAVGIGVGGFGGDGGDAAAVTASLTGQIETSGVDSTAVLAQSQGGGGGNGALNVSGALNVALSGTGAAVGIGVGGFGGGGGNGSDVSLVQSGNVTTTGANSGGVTAQSIGGGGGNGGINIAAGVAVTSTASSFGVALGLGGFGGSGGNAGNVTTTVDGSILASGLASDEIVTTPEVSVLGITLVDAFDTRVRADGSYGVLSQSIGGGGGNGAINVSAGIALGAPSSGKSYGLTLGVGGFGGGGGDAGTVNLDVITGAGGLVTAIGDDRAGVAAQSIGGGGGNGGINVSGGIAMDGVLALGFGGFGGDGGLGKDVTVNSNTAIQSAGTNGVGLLAQSIGGGGGNGGINISGGIAPKTTGGTPSLVFGMGGFGGAGDASGNVSVTQVGDINSEGSEAHGIMAQSIGGGGGNGALNVSGNATGSAKMAFVGGVGGHGGAGTDAGNVTVQSDGNITANGATAIGQMSTTANGIMAQSIGGGGGNGGMNISGVFVKTGNPVAIGVGGFGSGAGDAGSVSVNHGSNSTVATLIKTTSDRSAGIMAQSIGGGGGNAGVNIIGAVTTTGPSDNASPGDSKRCAGFDARLDPSVCGNWGKVVQQLSGQNSGGSGGSSTKKPVAVLIGVGGFGGEAGQASTANVTHTGDIETVGEDSQGILAQSIGGGGGNAAINLGLSYAKGGVGANVGLGGAPGDGGTGSAVTVDHSGTITTTGFDSAAIHAQSIGGGGGNAKLNLVTGVTPGGKINVGIGRRGGTGGAAGNVSVLSDSTITTTGDSSIGILAQSVGNGGGKSGSTSFGVTAKPGSEAVGANLAIGLEGGTGGESGTVDINVSGKIETSGSESHAVWAQSIGGGGGIGGMATTPVIKTSTIGLTLGGAGGTGAISDTVNVDSTAELVTRGDGAHAIYAQSIGGGGGVGGMAVAGGLQTGTGGALVTVGGTGGTGATSATTTVTNNGAIETLGAGSFGIYAQSLAGGGGDSGLTVNGVVSKGEKGGTNLSIAVGGDGGVGADAGAVIVTNTSSIITSGADSEAIRAQSIGGGGGNARMVANLLVDAVEGTTQIGITLGGTGGIGGSGGIVNVSNQSVGSNPVASIETRGENSYGIFAQSIGGGGGNGGSTIALNGAKGAKNVQLGFSLGGTGGSGGTGSDVMVANGGVIDTQGDGAHGIFAQSLGGGGGNGGLSIAANAVIKGGSGGSFSPVISIGGSGGDGNNAGNVTVNNTGSIQTAGAGAHGIVAESIGGGGGDGSISIGLTTGGVLLNAIAMSGAVGALLGGNGGDGGLGGDVTVNHSGDITLLGPRSEAIIAQSINGGGGNVVLNFGSIVGADDDSALILRAGSAQVSGSSAGTVTVNSTGTVNFAGDNGAGHAIQAIGGGGGKTYLTLDLTDLAASPDTPPDLSVQFGSNDGVSNSGGAIASMQDGAIVSAGRNADGVSLQSIGGGGGRGYLTMMIGDGGTGAIDFGLGSSAGTDEAGGTIAHSRIGSIMSSGDSAYGMLVQSIGGGGGSVNFRIDANAPATAMSADPRLGRATAGPTVTLGAVGGTGLDGGAINMDLTGDVMTTGANATGLLFQSIGGGGGESRITGVESLHVNLGGSAGASGNGGDLSIINNGSVMTLGARSHGVFLQSIGGGGGAVFTDAATVDVAFSAANIGNGGNITFNQTGDLFTAGEAAYGVFAQSLGGGGGYVDAGINGIAGGVGMGGDISLDLDGNVMATGTAATAVYVQSAGLSGAGDISVVLGTGGMIVGGANGIAVSFDGGVDNVLNNSGTVMSVDGVGGTAFTGTTGNDRIVNSGRLTGNVDLGTGINAISNQAGAVFDTGAVVNLGDAGNVLNNDGTLAPGGMGQALVTSLSGSYEQSANATAMIELDFDTETLDSLLATGTIQTGGTSEISLLNPHKVRPGSFQNTLFSAAGGLVDTGLSLMTQPSVVITYELLFPNATDATVGYAVDFSPAGVGGNLGKVGNYIGRVQTAGSSPELADTIIGLLFAPDLASYVDALTQLSPDFYAIQQANAMRSSQEFSRSLRTCESRDIAYRAAGQNSCVWLRIDDNSTDIDEVDNVPATQYDSSRTAVGFQLARNSWIFGLAASFGNQQSGGFDGRWSADGQTQQIGALAQRKVAGMQIAATLSYGTAGNFTARQIDFTDPRSTAASNRDIDTLGGTVNLYSTFRKGGFSIKPDFGVGMTKLTGRQVNEIGAGGQSLQLHKRSETRSWMEPSLEVGWDHAFSGGMTVRPYARVAILRYLSSDETGVSAGFQGAPTGVTPMVITTSLGDDNELYEAGLDLVSKTGFGLQLRYERLEDKFFDSSNVSLRFSVPL